MKKLPSLGFVYLFSVFIGFGVFLAWVVQAGWYARIHTPQQTEADLARCSYYLENIANDFDDSKKRVEILMESAQLRSRINQPQKALRILEKALILDPYDEALKALLLPLYWESGQKIKAIKFAKENLAAGQRNWGTLSVLLESVAEQPDNDLVLKVVQAVLEIDLPKKQVFGGGNIVALGLTADRWTCDGKPCFLIVSGSKVRLKLACYPGPQYTPLTTTIEDQTGEIIFSHVFNSPENLVFELPNIPVAENRLFVIKTDHFWVPPQNDNRRLGVMVTPSIQKQ